MKVPSSLKKMSGDEGSREGSYASTHSPQTRDHSELGLTLLPGSQAKNRGVGSGELPQHLHTHAAQSEYGRGIGRRKKRSFSFAVEDVRQINNRSFQEVLPARNTKASSLPLEIERTVVSPRKRRYGHGGGASSRCSDHPFSLGKANPRDFVREGLESNGIETGKYDEICSINNSSVGDNCKYGAELCSQDPGTVDRISPKPASIGIAPGQRCIRNSELVNESTLQRDASRLDNQRCEVFTKGKVSQPNSGIPWSSWTSTQGDRDLIVTQSITEDPGNAQAGACSPKKASETEAKLVRRPLSAKALFASEITGSECIIDNVSQILSFRRKSLRSWTSPIPIAAKKSGAGRHARSRATCPMPEILSRPSINRYAHSLPGRISSTALAEDFHTSFAKVSSAPSFNNSSSNEDFVGREQHFSDSLSEPTRADTDHCASHPDTTSLQTPLSAVPSSRSDSDPGSERRSTQSIRTGNVQTLISGDLASSNSTHGQTGNFTTSLNQQKSASVSLQQSEANQGNSTKHQWMEYTFNAMQPPVQYTVNKTPLNANNAIVQTNTPYYNIPPITPPISVHSNEDLGLKYPRNHGTVYEEHDYWHNQVNQCHGIIADLQRQLSEEKQISLGMRLEKEHVVEQNRQWSLGYQQRINELEWCLQYNPTKEMSRRHMNMHTELVQLRHRVTTQDQQMSNLRAENVRLTLTSKKPYARERSALTIAKNILLGPSGHAPVQSPAAPAKKHQNWHQQSGGRGDISAATRSPINQGPGVQATCSKARRADYQFGPSYAEAQQVPRSPHEYLQHDPPPHPNTLPMETSTVIFDPNPQPIQQDPVSAFPSIVPNVVAPHDLQISNEQDPVIAFTSMVPNVVAPQDLHIPGDTAAEPQQPAVIDLTTEKPAAAPAESTGAEFNDFVENFKNKPLKWLKGFRPGTSENLNAMNTGKPQVERSCTDHTIRRFNEGSGAADCGSSTAVGLTQEDATRIGKQLNEQKQQRKRDYAKRYRAEKKAERQADLMHSKTSKSSAGIRKASKGKYSIKNKSKSQDRVHEPEKESEYPQPMESTPGEDDSNDEKSPPASEDANCEAYNGGAMIHDANASIAQPDSPMHDATAAEGAEEELTEAELAAQIKAAVMQGQPQDEEGDEEGDEKFKAKIEAAMMLEPTEDEIDDVEFAAQLEAAVAKGQYENDEELAERVARIEAENQENIPGTVGNNEGVVYDESSEESEEE